MALTAATLTLVKGSRKASMPSGQVRSLPVDYPSDTALVDALVAGRPAAARALWERYAALSRRLLQRTLGADEVDDCLQDAFLRVLDRIDRLRDPSRLRSFVVGVTLRVARERLRHRWTRRWLKLWPTGELPATTTPAADFDAAEALARLDGLLDRLSPDARIVFVLRFVEELPTSEIAELHGWSLATAKRRVLRAQQLVERAAASDPVLASYATATAPEDPRGGDDG